MGITTDVAEATGGRLKADCGLAYAQRVAAAGGIPLLLPPIPEIAPVHARLCDALIFTGGDDPRTEAFGVPTHPRAKPMHPQRQAYEVRLLEILRDEQPDKPVLGICLGMQLMALLAGGRLNQHLPDTHATAAEHRGVHAVRPIGAVAALSTISSGDVLSNHHQSVATPGGLSVTARSPDGVIEAVADPARRFYLGVQWHPERTENAALGQAMFDQLVSAARR